MKKFSLLLAAIILCCSMSFSVPEVKASYLKWFSPDSIDVQIIRNNTGRADGYWISSIYWDSFNASFQYDSKLQKFASLKPQGVRVLYGDAYTVYSFVSNDNRTADVDYEYKMHGQDVTARVHCVYSSW